VNFYQAPVARRIALTTKTESSVTFVTPLAPASGIFPAHAFGHGLNVTLFLETPGWPTSASKINVRGNAISGSTSNCTVAPNVCLSDADSYLFLRGNNVYANNSTPANGSHIVYCAQLDINSVGSARSAAENDYWVRPGDTFTFTNPFTGPSGSNIGTDGIRSTPVITSVRHKSGSRSLLIEFTVPINTATNVSGYAGGDYSAWKGRELIFFDSASPGIAETSKGLSYNRLTLKVTGPSSAWTGTLSNATNLTYTAANRPGLIPVGSAPLSADMVDPSKMIVCNSASLAANGRLHMGLTGTAAYHNDYAFEHISDFSQGSVPYRCISFSASAGSWIIEALVHPLH